MVVFYPWVLLNIAGVVGSFLNYFLPSGSQGFKFYTTIISAFVSGLFVKRMLYIVQLFKFLAEVSFE